MPPLPLQPHPRLKAGMDYHYEFRILCWTNYGVTSFHLPGRDRAGFLANGVTTLKTLDTADKMNTVACAMKPDRSRWLFVDLPELGFA